MTTTELVSPEQAPVAAATRSGVGFSLRRLVAGALLAAELTALLAVPWSGVRGLLPAMLLALPLTLLTSALLAAGTTLVAGRRGERLKPVVARAALVAVTGVLVFSIGAGICNLLLIDQALKPRMLLGYAVSGVVALVGAGLVWWRLQRGQLGHWLRQRSSRALGLLIALPMTCVFALFDALFLTHGYWTFHVALLALTLLSASVLFQLCISTADIGRWAAVGTTTAALSCVPALTAGSSRAIFDAMLATPTAHQRLLLLARGASDRDGDGYSAVLGGGDCDDRSRTAYPLSLRGRDCLGWMDGAPASPPVAPVPSADTASGARPDVIVLASIDAFRCGFGRAEIPELLRACPVMERLAAEGRLKLDAYTSYPGTAKALRALHTLAPADFPGGRPLYLADFLKQRGFSTHGISTPGLEFSKALAEPFDQVDRELDAVARDATVITAEMVTDRILATVRAQPAGKPLFVWAHYLDPHAPYVETPGSIWGFSSIKARYALEVERTDRAIGRLAAGLRELGASRRPLLLVTADHGEGLGEKGLWYHGSALNDPAVRIPMLVWSPTPEVLPVGEGTLPASASEVPAFLAARAAGAPFVSSGEAFFHARVRGGYWFGLYREGWKITHHQVYGWTELFNVAADPLETHDLSQSEPRKLAEMKRRLSPYLRTPREGSGGDD